MKLTENQLEWIQDKVRDQVSDKFRETILNCAKAIKNNDIIVCQVNYFDLFSRVIFPTLGNKKIVLMFYDCNHKQKIPCVI